MKPGETWGQWGQRAKALCDGIAKDCGIGNHKLHAGETDKPIAALMTDLKRTGLWDETLLIWGGEFGRTPTSEGLNKPGRDHNPHGFSVWLAGAGVKGGQAIGATDELGFKAVEEPWHVSDLHATILHLMGLEHEKLTYFHAGMNQRLTGVRGDLLQIAQAERGSIALNGKCTSLDELISSGTLTMTKPERDGYVYSLECSGNEFAAVARHAPATEVSPIRYPILRIDSTMEVHEISPN